MRATAFNPYAVEEGWGSRPCLNEGCKGVGIHGKRLVTFLMNLFMENVNARYGLTTMCVGRGQGYSVIWENMHNELPRSRAKGGKVRF